MGPLTFRSWRAHRTVVERLMGVESIYVTEITDGYRTVRARGSTEEASVEKAQTDWEKSSRPK